MRHALPIVECCFAARSRGGSRLPLVLVCAPLQCAKFFTQAVMSPWRNWNGPQQAKSAGICRVRLLYGRTSLEHTERLGRPRPKDELELDNNHHAAMTLSMNSVGALGPAAAASGSAPRVSASAVPPQPPAPLQPPLATASPPLSTALTSRDSAGSGLTLIAAATMAMDAHIWTTCLREARRRARKTAPK